MKKRIEERIAPQAEDIKDAGRLCAVPFTILSLVFCAVAFFPRASFLAQTVPVSPSAAASNLPLRAAAARRFLARRGWVAGHRLPQRRSRATAHSAQSFVSAQVQAGSSLTWTPLGPTAVQTTPLGLVTGRITAVAFDPSDITGNHVYVGTTGGGVWAASNAAVSNTSLIAFTPLTDSLSALGAAPDPSISIGALAVQPGGTGVVLAGTGDPNDVLDSYYGAGILRSTDGGTTWTLISQTTDLSAGLSTQDFAFTGEGFAGFAWSTADPQLVVAAVSQAYEGELVDATEAGGSMQGLYYSQDSGATWHLATISDGSGQDVQGPVDSFAKPDGNAATAVVWNPVRKLFLAAVRYHGYYQSADGVTWTRLAAQPGAGLTTQMCPTNTGTTGSIACPIFRGALAVNPQNGDTFAWSVDLNEQDQGLWQDQCSASGGACANPSLAFAQQWSAAPLETDTAEGPATIADGVYNLVLAAVPSGQGTMVLAGANDVWQTTCPAALGCQWRNTTNSTTCMSAKVGEFQHALAWNAQNPLEIFIGNDSGLWRSMDGIAETGSVCASTDASHFQNLNGALGSLAEVESLSQVTATPYAMITGLGVNGTAGVNANSVTADWPQILGGYGGPVAIDPQDTSNWYANDQAGVAIYACSQAGCSPAGFGSAPVITDADVDNDGLVMPTPAPFLVDPLDDRQLLVGTCRVWRGPASGSGWTAANAISPILDSDSTSGSCHGDALIRSMAAAAAPGGEIVYVGTYGSSNGGSILPGHILSATLNSNSSSMPTWNDLTFHPVGNDDHAFNALGFDISSIAIDPHDATGNTVYVTIAGMSETGEPVQPVYRSTNGGATWNVLTANLPNAPVNAVAVDPESANTVYVATDEGVSYTTEISACAQLLSNCWSPYGTGLPQAPVVALSAGAAPQVLVAGTYGRGIWQTGLWSATANLSAASAAPGALLFSSQPFATTSSPQKVTLTNTSSAALEVASIAFTGDSSDFAASGNCLGQSVPAGGTCSLQVTFTPQATGQRTAQMIVYANVYGGQLSVDLNGTGLPGGDVIPNPLSVAFPQVEVGSTSTPLQVTLTNSGTLAVPIASIAVAAPFTLAANACGTSLGIDSACQLQIAFAPTQAGPATGLLTIVDGAGTQTVQLSGTGAAAPTDLLSPASIAFPSTASGQISAAQPVTITNNGDLPLAVTSIAASANFQQSSNCLSGVAAHSTCNIGVQFAPAQTGPLTGTLTLNDQLGTQTVSLSGTGLPPAALLVVPSSLSFPQQQPGVASAPQTLTVTNSGGMAMANIGFQFTGPAAANYSVASTTCGALLASTAQCTVQIVFTPSVTGQVSAALSISSSTAGVSAASVPLNGTGQLAAGLQANPSQLPFATVIAVGQASAAQPVNITNTSSYSISSVTLAVTAPFTLVQNSCAGSLGAGASCAAGVEFAPSSSGPASGTLTVSSTDVATPASVALSGTGFNFTVAPSGSTSQTVTSGQQADYTLVITPNGAQSTFSLQCGSLPTNALCVFNPATETLSAGVQGNVVVEIYTGNSGVTARAEPLALRNWPLACAVVLLPLAFWRRRRLLLLALLALALPAGISSCTGSSGGSGGNSGGQGGSNATPPGTYSIPVTVSSMGLTQSVTLTLTVD